MLDRPISWGELIAIVLFILGAALLFYLILAVSHLVRVLKNVNGIIEKNKDNINKTVEKLPKISENAEKITDSLKNNMEAIDGVVKDIGKISTSVKKGVETVQNDILVKAKIVVDIVDTIKKFFDKKKDAPSKKKSKGTVYKYKYKKGQEKPDEVEIITAEAVDNKPYSGYEEEAATRDEDIVEEVIKDEEKE
jgi:uncharacterized protein YoxC